MKNLISKSLKNLSNLKPKFVNISLKQFSFVSQVTGMFKKNPSKVTHGMENINENELIHIKHPVSPEEEEIYNKDYKSSFPDSFYDELEKAGIPASDPFLYKKPILALKDLRETLNENTNTNSTDLHIDLILKFNITPLRPEHNLNFLLKVPYPPNDPIKILAFTPPQQAEEALKLGADYIINEVIYKEILERKFRFNKVVATNDVLKNLKKLEKFLKPEGLFPSKLSGTCTYIENFQNVINVLKEGATEYTLGKNDTIVINIGKLNQKNKELIENLNEVLKQCYSIKPKSIIGRFLLSASFKADDYEKKLDILKLNPENTETYFYNSKYKIKVRSDVKKNESEEVIIVNSTDNKENVHA